MNRYLAVIGGAALTGATVLTSATAGAHTSSTAGTSGAWRTAQEVPGTAALNAGGDAGITSVSCASAGNCGAGGFYADRSGAAQAFVVSQVGGVWRKAVEVPGTAALNTGGEAQIISVSCASAGDCGAGGYYTDRSGAAQAFVVSQVRGVWGKAVQVAGSAAVNTGGDARINSVSCASAGNCAAGGFYTSRSGRQGFVVSQVRGVWGKAMQDPGSAALNTGGAAQVVSVSCASAGDCAAGGYYTDRSHRAQAFVVGQVRGVWGKAMQVPGTAALNTGGAAQVVSVSCASAGDCGAGGFYTSRSGRQGFVVSQVRGGWRKAAEVPGSAALNVGGNAGITAVSCAAAGNCGAGGYYTDRSRRTQALAVSQAGGIWRTATEVPGSAALDVGGHAQIMSLSCASAGNCGAGGYYNAVKSGKSQAFVVSQVRGAWGKAAEVPGSAALNAGGFAGVNSVSCAAAGNCAAVGGYTDSAGNPQVFAVSDRLRLRDHEGGAMTGRLEEVAEGVFAYIQPDGSWMINNTGFLPARDGVTAIDACSTERRTRDFLDTVHAVTRRPVRTLVNTHHHPDHTAGNGLFTQATIVAHDNARPEMRLLGLPRNTGIWTDVDYGNLQLTLPFLTFSDRLTLWVDELRCELLFAGQPAHTNNDIVAWIPARSVLFAGDLLFNGGTPFLLSGSVTGAAQVLESFVRPLGARTIVPGHGPVAGPEIIDEVLGYLRFVRETAVRGRAAGLTPLEAARECDLGRYAEWSDTERIVGNLHRAYGDLAAAEPGRAGDPGGAVDVFGALADMVTYNGGRPLTCLA